jgi:hypothetical protein
MATTVSSLADSHYDELHVLFVHRLVNWGDYRISYTYSKALDDVGEFFFSSPINTFNIWQDYGRSGDDQRNRLSFDGTIHPPLANANTTWGHLTRGFQLTAMLQYYSPLPFNITTGANTIQGTTARPTINGIYVNRNAGTGFDVLNFSGRLSRSFQLTERLRLEAIIEGFNLTNHVNEVTLNGVFGTLTYPTNPSLTYKQVTAVGDPRGFQFAVRVTF